MDTTSPQTPTEQQGDTDGGLAHHAAPASCEPVASSPLTWRARCLNGLFLTAATVCFAAAIVMLAVLHFRYEYDLLTAGDFALLLFLGPSFAFLGWLALEALRQRMHGESARAHRLLAPALLVCWLLLVVTTLGRFPPGRILLHVRQLASVSAVVLTLIFISGWRSLPPAPHSDSDPSPRPPPRDSRC